VAGAGNLKRITGPNLSFSFFKIGSGENLDFLRKDKIHIDGGDKSLSPLSAPALRIVLYNFLGKYPCRGAAPAAGAEATFAKSPKER